ncbi:MAG: cell division protein ZapB [Acidiferrobacter sp.]
MSDGSAPDVEVLKKLEGRVDDLIALCRRLQEDNARWRARHQALSAEHARLNERTRAARARVEEMIGRVAILTRESR